MRPMIFLFFSGLLGNASLPALAELSFQQNDVAGVSSAALLKSAESEIAATLRIPVQDISALRSGGARVLDGLSQTESATYAYFKRLYPGDFEADFAADFTESFATNYSDAWSRINLEGNNVTMGTGFAHEDVSARLPARIRLPLTARLIVDPGNDFAPGGLRRGTDRSIKMIFLDEDGQRWSIDLSENGNNAWQVDTPRLADAADNVTLDPQSVARVGTRLVAVSHGEAGIWLSENDGADWRRIARNDSAFDEGRKDVLRARGFDDASMRSQIVTLFESMSDTREMPSAEEIEDLIWNERRSVSTIHAFRSNATDPELVYVSFSGGGLGELRLDDLISSGDSFATTTAFFSAPYAGEWNGNNAPYTDFTVRQVTTSVPGQGTVQVRRAAVVLPENLRKIDVLSRSEEDFMVWQRDVLDNWGPSSIALFSDDDGGIFYQRTSAQDLKVQFRNVLHGGDGQVTFSVDEDGTLYFATDLDSQALDNSAFDLARARSSDEVERARQAFNRGVEEAKAADRGLPSFASGFPMLRAYGTISQLHWTPLDRDVVAAVGTRSGVWILLHSGRLRHYQAPPITAASQGSLRPAPDELLTLKSMLIDAIQERDLLADLMRVNLAAVSETRRLATSDIAKFRLALRLESGGFVSKTTTTGGEGVDTGAAILGGVAALFSEVPFAATFLNVANLALGVAQSASDKPRTIANPQAAGFDALQVAGALNTELKTGFDQQEQAIRFARQVCLASPAARAACLDPRGLISQPAEPLLASGLATQYLPPASAQNVLQARYVAQVRGSRQRARCLVWNQLLPRMGFIYGGPITPGYRTFNEDDGNNGQFIGTDDGTPFKFGPLGSGEKTAPFMFTKATRPELNNVTVTIAWTLRIGTVDLSKPMVRTPIDTDGLEGSFSPGPVLLPLNGPGQLGVSDIFFSCGDEGAQKLLSGLDRYAQGVVHSHGFTPNHGIPWALPILVKNYGFPEQMNVREKLIRPSSFDATEVEIEHVFGPFSLDRYYFGGTPNWINGWQLMGAVEQRL